MTCPGKQPFEQRHRDCGWCQGFKYSTRCSRTRWLSILLFATFGIASAAEWGIFTCPSPLLLQPCRFEVPMQQVLDMPVPGLGNVSGGTFTVTDRLQLMTATLDIWWHGLM